MCCVWPWCYVYHSFKYYNLSLVLYAADLGSYGGLDIQECKEREAVLQAISLRDYDPMHNTADPFLPEWCSFRVCSITRGTMTNVAVYVHIIKFNR